MLSTRFVHWWSQQRIICSIFRIFVKCFRLCPFKFSSCLKFNLYIVLLVLSIFLMLRAKFVQTAVSRTTQRNNCFPQRNLVIHNRTQSRHKSWNFSTERVLPRHYQIIRRPKRTWNLGRKYVTHRFRRPKKYFDAHQTIRSQMIN